MKANVIVTLLYALIVFGGGIMGFAQAHSLASLIAGSLSALVLFCAAFMLHREITVGFYLAFAATFFLLFFFGYRFTLSYKFMPAGFMALLSLAVLLTLFILKPKSP
jgi:uncharacterized membrane protein (UPF0136 family)